MKKILISIAAASALAAAALPAAAQSYDRGYDRGHQDGGRWDDRGGPERGIVRGDDLQVRINRAERHHQISRREAFRLREQLRIAESLSWRYRADGVVTRWERADLDRRFDSIRIQLRYERNDRDYGSGYGGYGGDRR
ncbi:hypothetical protein JKL49_02265 [Phenylobacterium sp. 20VBR1]|uniref:Antifreeze protein n=1 Tax=Phenylobacterium glaciei TaxID=2803784 RepID=A0A941CX33_9CAUL|nr:hypothetical protein [Phenylobacterium glaciei]MBR7618200.1 hypothetical protein [Phenylobacterium glaciei]